MSEVTFEDNSKQFLSAKEEAVRRFLEEAGQHLSGEAADELDNPPKRVDTGLLHNSITYALDGEGAAINTYKADTGGATGSYSGQAPEEPKGSDAVYVGTNVEYAPYVHYGTRRMAANAFIKNAFEKNKDQLQSKLKKALQGE